MAATEEQIRAALARVIDPELRKDLVELEMVRGIAIDGGDVTVGVALTIPGCPLKATIDADVTRDGWVQALEEMYAQLDGAAAPSNERRQLVATAIRFGSLRVMGGQGDAVAQAEK